MELKKKYHPAVAFIVLNLFPVIVLICGHVILVLVFSLSNGISRVSFLLLASSIVFPLLFDACLSIPFVLGILLCYALFKITASWFARGMILYVFWMILIGGMLFVVLAALGGVSMAVADGVVKRAEFYSQVLGAMLLPLLFSNILIVPWIMYCIKRLKRTEFLGKEASHA